MIISLRALLLGTVISTVRAQNNDLKNYQVVLKPDVKAQSKNLRQTTWGLRVDRIFRLTAAGDALCSDPLESYVAGLMSGLSEEDIDTMVKLAIDQIPFFYSLFTNHWHESDEYFGTFGEETQEMVLGHDALRSFWSGLGEDDGRSNTDYIMLRGMHGADMKDPDKLLPTVEFMYDLNATDLTYPDLAGMIQTFVDSLPHEYDNPLLTLNAFAAPAEFGAFGGKIIVGDGIIEYLHYQNVGAEGPEFVLSHEFGHHLQYDMGLQNHGGLPEPLEARRFELMADALGGYFLAHVRGANMTDHRILELQRAAFSVGDCDDENPDHHGTPSQRECAVVWGIKNAASAAAGEHFAPIATGEHVVPTAAGEHIVQTAVSEHILHPAELSMLFDQDLERIVSLDESVCSFPVPRNNRRKCHFPHWFGYYVARGPF